MIHKMLDWFKSLFWKEEMELTLVGLQHAGKTTFVNVIASGQFNEVIGLNDELLSGRPVVTSCTTSWTGLSWRGFPSWSSGIRGTYQGRWTRMV